MRIASTVAVAIASSAVLSSGAAQSKPAAALAGIVRAFLAENMGNGWEDLEQLPSIRWAPLPPTDLPNCLPDGGCYTRQGQAVVSGRNLVAMATGARTIVAFVYLRNGSAPFTDAAILESLAELGISAERARCPTGTGAGGTNWYRLTGASLAPGVLSIQTSCGRRPCEGVVLSRGEELPALQPNQVSLYSEQCAAGVPRPPVSTRKPDEVLADTIAALVPPGSGAPGHDWKTLATLPAGITWNGDGPKPGNLSVLNDPNPMIQTGSAVLGGRRFSAIASGSPARASVVYLEETGTHPRGEHVLGVVFQKGLTVELVRCGPIYTESTNNWYRLTSGRTRPVMLRQSIGYDGNLAHDIYELRLDGSLPPRDPRDRDPGMNGCR